MYLTIKPLSNLTQSWSKSLLAFFLTTLVVCHGTVSATPKTATDARRVVRGWLAKDHGPLGIRTSKDTARVDTYPDADAVGLYHVVHLEPSGFVITSADDQIEPIVAFANDGAFKFSEDNPLYTLLMRDMRARMRTITEKGKGLYCLDPEEATRVRVGSQLKWKRFDLSAEESIQTSVSETPLSFLLDVRVGPLLETRWGQTTSNGNPCYNYFTPNFNETTGDVEFRPGDFDNYPCGCVATALSQLLYYHRYPEEGPVQSHYGITVTSQDGLSQERVFVAAHGGDGRGGPYRWDLMPTAPDMDANEVQRQAIGRLCADAGAAVHTSYRINDSAASIGAIVPALHDTFQYNSATLGIDQDSRYVYELTPRIEPMMNPNLDAGYPVLLCIFSDSYTGHAVVADGYGYRDSTAFYHLNMGWGETDEVWYNLPTIEFFTCVGACIYNVFPEQEGEIISGRVVDACGDPVSGALVVLVGGTDQQNVHTNRNGIYAFTGLMSEATYGIAVSKPGCRFIPYSVAVTTGRSIHREPVCGNVWGVDFELCSPDSNAASLAVSRERFGDGKEKYAEQKRMGSAH